MPSQFDLRRNAGPVQPKCTVLGSAARLFGTAFAACILAALGLSGCSSAEVRGSASPEEPPNFSGIGYPAPAAVDPGPAQLPLAEQTDLPLPSGVRRQAPVDAGQMAQQLRNAALRDQEHERLGRQYFGLVELLSRVGAGKGESADNYDPLPLYRLHHELRQEMSHMRTRAQALAARWHEIAVQLGIPLLGDTEAPGREGRLRLVARYAECVIADLDHRLAHGVRFQLAKKSGVSDDDLRQDPPPGMQYVQDIRMMAQTLECVRLSSRVLRGR